MVALLDILLMIVSVVMTLEMYEQGSYLLMILWLLVLILSFRLFNEL